VGAVFPQWTDRLLHVRMLSRPCCCSEGPYTDIAQHLGSRQPLAAVPGMGLHVCIKVLPLLGQGIPAGLPDHPWPAYAGKGPHLPVCW
jgi:hypothetical protein